MGEAWVTRRKLSDQVVDRVKLWMMTQPLQPGERLPQEKELMKLLGVSRGTVREALKALEVQGIVRVSTGRSGGAVIAETSYDTAASLLGNYFYFQKLQTSDIYALRRLIEPEMAVSAIGSLTDADLKRLEHLIDACARAEDTPTSRRKQRLDELEFHNVIARRSPNPLYSFTCRFLNKILADQVVVKRMYLERQETIDRENNAAHTELLAAYQAGDDERVFEVMARHMNECSCHMADLEAVVERSFFSDTPTPRLEDFLP